MPQALGAAPAESSIWGGPVSVQSARTNPFNSDVSTAATIVIMRRLAHQYARDPSVAAVTAEALSGGAYTQRDIACAIFHWIRSNVAFVEDETLMYAQLGVAPQHLDKELLIVPPVLLAMPQPMGDCDDFSLLTASMLMNAGVRAFFVTVAADPTDPRKFSHIYVCAQLADEGSYICLDPGNRLDGIPPGWEVERVTRKAIWAI